MTILDLTVLNDLSKNDCTNALEKINIKLYKYSAQERISWAFETLSSVFVMSSSFGIQSAVLLHMVTQQKPDIPVILIDTGYMFPETYNFIDELTEQLNLNLCVFRSKISPAWQETRYGKLWKQGIEGIKKYNFINKVEPMNFALRTIEAKTWFAGLRRQQSSTRFHLPILSIQRHVFKVLPIVDWNNRMIHQYLKKNKLRYHPLWTEGYVSVGDVHTTSKLQLGMTEEDTRFFGLKRECGLHED